MNRKIVFRGKCAPDTKYAGEWVTGGYVPLSEGITPNNEGLIMRFLGGDITITYHVVPSTVGQFTGLHDRDGREIYEGDIVEVTSMRAESCGQKMTCEIVYDEQMACYDFKTPDRQRNICVSILDVECKVIGNVHDNPELLKGGEK